MEDFIQKDRHKFIYTSTYHPPLHHSQLSPSFRKKNKLHNKMPDNLADLLSRGSPIGFFLGIQFWFSNFTSSTRKIAISERPAIVD